MAAETKIIITDYRANIATGRIEVELQCLTEDGNASWRGPKRLYSCDPQMLRDRFHGNIEEFEAWAASEHRPFVGLQPEMVNLLLKRKGMVVG